MQHQPTRVQLCPHLFENGHGVESHLNLDFNDRHVVHLFPFLLRPRRGKFLSNQVVVLRPLVEFLHLDFAQRQSRILS